MSLRYSLKRHTVHSVTVKNESFQKEALNCVGILKAICLELTLESQHPSSSFLNNKQTISSSFLKTNKEQNKTLEKVQKQSKSGTAI